MDDGVALARGMLGAVDAFDKARHPGSAIDSALRLTL
jgi:hypothetical protein